MNIRIKKNIRKIAGIVLLIILIAFSWYLINRFSFSKEFSYYPVNKDKDSTLTIGIIGDSWIEKEKVDSIVHYFLVSASVNCKVLAAGESSAKSKFVYQNLFKDNAEQHSSKFIIESRPDYCIVVTGVNDATGQMGPNFYSYHIRQIIKTLLHYKIKPVVVSLPEFGIEETPANLNAFTGFIWRLRNKTFALFNNHGETDNIKSYRKKLGDDLVIEKLKDSVIMIDFDKICIDYYECPGLYADRGHLSLDGKIKLCRLITDELIKTINSH